ncbi:MAG: hypothetical protein WBA91_02785 [Paracoccaceae bacterium]
MPQERYKISGLGASRSGRGWAVWPIALGLSLVWLALVALFYFLAGGFGAGGGLMALIAVVMPLALIWAVAMIARSVEEIRAEARSLQSSVDAVRAALASERRQSNSGFDQQTPPSGHAEPSADAALATFTSRRDATVTQASADKMATLISPRPDDRSDDQTSLALGTPAEDLAQPVSRADFVRALNFPDSQDDKEGIRALRRALDDRTVAKLVRAAQDVLTLLGQDGIYMDDLKADRIRPELWRRFATGERGKTIAALGGVRDRSSLALATGRMRQDTIFRDAAHHFLRQFDRSFVDFETDASDQDIVALSETRTARAFMLLGRAAGTFD